MKYLETRLESGRHGGIVRPGVDKQAQVHVENADVNRNGHDDEGERPCHCLTDDLQLAQLQVAEHPLPEVVTHQGQAQEVRVDSNVLDTVNSLTLKGNPTLKTEY